MNRKFVLSLTFLCVLPLLGTSAIAKPVNVNTSSPQEIAESLVGIGSVKAEAISKYCQENACEKAEDLLAVKGIGEKTLEKITADLRFKDECSGEGCDSN